MKKLLIVTPTGHIKGFDQKAKKNFETINLNNPTDKELLKNIKTANFIFTNPNMSKIFFSRKNLSSAKNLSCICTASTGTNHIDLNYLKKKRIKLISLRNKLKIITAISSTAELAFALMMNALRNVNSASDSVKRGKWSYLPYIGRQMNFLTVGVIGYGRLGKIFTKFLKPFTKNILIYEKEFKIKDNNKTYQSSLKELLRKSDVISFHIHADKKNINFLNANKLRLLKKNVVIINTSRGEIIDETQICKFLDKNKNAKYFTDVLMNEIKSKNKSPIFSKFKKKNKQVLITPHIGGMTEDAQELAYHGVLDDLIKFSNSKVK